MKEFLTYAALFVFVGTSCQAAFAGEAASEVPEEMKVLERLVGEWRDDCVLKATKWHPEEAHMRLRAKCTSLLNGRFVRVEVFSETDKLLNIQMFTFDANAKEYRNWIFDDAGRTSEGKGQWNASTQTLTFTGPGDGGTTGLTAIRFLDKDHRLWRNTWTDANGELGLDTVGSSTRTK